ncbi:V/A-type H+-transporting ATPase subunit E [Halomicrobium zhouii]|uniref:A-type ATP synthase subunit E n=1 Tax=Halomicrobium zhouii TaxID=767519 RepID=A0A1I6KEK5_9EURY|nr:V-type ATP synthase subunit E [Halomicrobium zhouii]SFR89672.1 V/A-type H+-transporting ATPase subunit E [Halomicrobium zhouii]
MSLDTVAEDIRDEARARAEEIRAEAEDRADEIVADAEAEAETIRSERSAEVEREIEQEREQSLSSAKLEAKQSRLEARRDLLEEVREDVEAAVAGLEGDKRETLTRELLDDAADEFDGGSVRVFGRAEDKELLESILADYDGFEYAGEYDCLGGVVVESDASRIRVNNTFDSVLDDVWEDNLRDVSERLFEEQ